MRHDHYFHESPGLADVHHQLRELKDLVMNLQDTINQLAADDTELVADVEALVAIIDDIPARIQAAIVSALADAGVPDDATRAALDNADIAVKGAIEEAKKRLPTAPVAPVADPAPPVDGGSDASPVDAAPPPEPAPVDAGTEAPPEAPAIDL